MPSSNKHAYALELEEHFKCILSLSFLIRIFYLRSEKTFIKWNDESPWKFVDVFLNLMNDLNLMNEDWNRASFSWFFSSNKRLGRYSLMNSNNYDISSGYYTILSTPYTSILDSETCLMSYYQVLGYFIWYYFLALVLIVFTIINKHPPRYWHNIM